MFNTQIYELLDNIKVFFNIFAKKVLIMKIIDEQLLNETQEKAKLSPRLRMNYNFHDSLDATINRLINAMEPDTYLRPHRHLNPDKEEIFLLLRGRVAVFIFDDNGNITQNFILDPRNGMYGAEIPAGVWHGLLVLDDGAVVYEIKEGPYAPLSLDNLAPWSPDADNRDEVVKYLAWLRDNIDIR